MAIYRQIHVTFWTDPYVLELAPEEKMFYIFLLTNQNTTLCGIYEMSTKLIAFQTGYDRSLVKKLLQKFQEDNKIRYSEQTDEVCIRNWLKYNINSSPKLLPAFKASLSNVKDKSLIPFLYGIYSIVRPEEFPNTAPIDHQHGIYTPDMDDGCPKDTASIPYQYPIDTVSIPYPPVTDTDTVTDTERISTTPAHAREDGSVDTSDPEPGPKPEAEGETSNDAPAAPPLVIVTTKPSRQAEDPPEVIQGYGLTPRLDDAVKLWIAYKRTRRFSYKDEGLNTLISQVRKRALECGEDAVIEAIKNAIANGYQGMGLERIRGAPGNENLRQLRERLLREEQHK